MSTYTVTDTREISQMSPSGAVSKIYRVYITTENGATGTLDVPEKKWKPATIKQLLQDRADELELAFTAASEA